MRLRDAFEITALTPRFIEQWAASRATRGSRRLRSRSRGEIAALHEGQPDHRCRQVAVRRAGSRRRRSSQALRSLQPRLYSLASSAEFAPDEAHLCVAPVRFALNGSDRGGVASLFLAETLEAGRQRAGLHPAQRQFPPAAGPEDADRHDRRGHGGGALPQLHAASRGAGHRRAKLAVLRRAQLPHRLPLPDRMAGLASQRRADARRPGVLAGRQATRSTSSIACRSRPPSSTAGSRTAPMSTSAAMPSTWRATSTRRCWRIVAGQGGRGREAAEAVPARAAGAKGGTRGMSTEHVGQAPGHPDRSRDISQPLEKLHPDETLKAQSNYLRGTIVAEPRGPDHRRGGGNRHQAAEVPRHLPAGRSRPARGAPAAEARAGLAVHDPRAARRRRLHAGAVAEAVGARARLRQPERCA